MITWSTVTVPGAGTYHLAARRTLTRTGLVYGILWLSEGTCTWTWAPLLSLHSICPRWTTGLLGIFNKACGLSAHMEAGCGEQPSAILISCGHDPSLSERT